MLQSTFSSWTPKTDTSYSFSDFSVSLYWTDSLCQLQQHPDKKKFTAPSSLWSQAQGSTFLICDKNSTIPGIPNSCLLASLEASGKFLFFLRSVRAIKDTNSPFSLTIGSFPVIQEEALYIKNGQYTRPLQFVSNVVQKCQAWTYALRRRQHKYRYQVRLLTFFAPLQNAVGFLKCHTILSNNQVFSTCHHLHNYIMCITHKRYGNQSLPVNKFIKKVKEKAYSSQVGTQSQSLHWSGSHQSARSKQRSH